LFVSMRSANRVVGGTSRTSQDALARLDVGRSTGLLVHVEKDDTRREGLGGGGLSAGLGPFDHHGPGRGQTQTLEFTHSTGVLVIVPEPGALALAGIGIAAAASAARRRR
jgi:hypothetical protein